jgi:predicted GNAT family N-acyltransferase
MTAVFGVPLAKSAGRAAWIEVREPATPAEHAAILALRRRVFGDEQGMSDAGNADADDARSIHAIALLRDRLGGQPVPVGTGRITIGIGPSGSSLVTWVATLPAYRRRGIGEAVMRFLLDAADRAGAPAVVLSAQEPAIRFYLRLGFTPYGQRFRVQGIEHQPMVKRSRGSHN